MRPQLYFYGCHHYVFIQLLLFLCYVHAFGPISSSSLPTPTPPLSLSPLNVRAAFSGGTENTPEQTVKGESPVNLMYFLLSYTQM